MRRRAGGEDGEVCRHELARRHAAARRVAASAAEAAGDDGRHLSSSPAEDEHVRLDARLREGEREGALFHGSWLADDLVQAVLLEKPIAGAVDVDSTGGAGRLAVEENPPEGNRSAVPARLSTRWTSREWNMTAI